MNKTTLKDIQTLSGYVYKDGHHKLPDGCKRIGVSDNSTDGFYAEAFYKNGEVYIIYRGTDLDKGRKEATNDLLNDKDMIFNISPKQLLSARYFYDTIAKDYKNCKIYLCGHSLGGSLAQIIGSTVKGLETITLNAFGTRGFSGFKPKYPENITNYGNIKDIVFTKNINNHVGKTMIIPNNNALMPHLKKFHSVKEMGDLDSAVEYTRPLSPAKRLEQRLKREWEESTVKRDHSRDKFKNTQNLKGYYNETAKNNRIFTEDEICRFSTKEKNKHHAAIEYQRKTIGIPSGSQVKRAISSGGMVHVKAYVRADGVQVHSYYRSAPHR